MLDSPPSAPVLTAATSPKKALRWRQWMLVAVSILCVVVGATLFMLDPWLRRTLERQVATASGGYYQLRIGELRTSLWRRSITLRNVQLRSAGAATSQHLPPLRTSVGLIHVQGIGLWELVRKKTVPVDAVQVQHLRLGVGKIPPSSASSPKALHEQLPLQLDGIRIGYLALLDLGGNYRPAGRRPVAALRRADVLAHDIFISPAGAADSQRLGYARRLAFQLVGFSGQFQQHTSRFAALRFSTERQRLELDSVRVQPLGEERSSATAPRLTLTLPRLRLTGLRAPQLAHRQLRADSLLLTSPNLTFEAGKSAPTSGSLHERLTPWLRRAVVRYVALARGQLQLPGLRQKPTFQAIEVRGYHLQLDSLAARDPARIYYARAWQVRIGPSTAVVEAPFYRARYQQLFLDTRTGSAQVNNLTLTPTMGAAEFARRQGKSVSCLTVQIPQMQLRGLDYAALAREGAVVAKVLEVRNPRLQVTGDANYPQPARISSVSPEHLAQLPFRVAIDLARIVNFTFRSAEIVQGGSVPGVFSITRFTADITHLHNSPTSKAPPSIARVSGWLEDKCKVEGVFRFNLHDPMGRHSFVGTFGAAPFAIVNPVSEPGAFIRFERGQLQRMVCRLTFDRQGARGILWARYNDLKISLLKKKPGPNKKNILTRAGSLLANKLIVRDNNPRRAGQTLEPGQVNVERDLRYSVFRVWRVAVVDGVLSSFGVPEAIAKKVE